jgi:hypothetical protein
MDMVWGMTLATFTFVHVVLSLVAIGSGIVVATSVTGFGFPVAHVLPSHVVGVVSLAVLAIAIVARYVRRLEGAWGRIYVICPATALYLNVFVGVVQAFMKVSPLFIVLAVLAAKRFRGASISHV